MGMAEAVADSSAILAFLNAEVGGDVVLRYRSVLVCAVNHAEIVGKLVDRGFDDTALAAATGRLKYQIADFDIRVAELTGSLRRDPRARNLSLGDRACLSLALQTGLPVLTADRAWSSLELGVDVRLIR